MLEGDDMEHARAGCKDSQEMGLLDLWARGMWHPQKALDNP